MLFRSINNSSNNLSITNFGRFLTIKPSILEFTDIKGNVKAGIKKALISNTEISRSNEFLKKEIDDGNFREDLYHRLAVIVIKVPELSKRKSDIPVLVDHFSNIISKEQGIETKKFSKDSLKLLEDYNWSGNVRELRNVVERLIILGGETISKDDVSLFATKK